MTASAPSVPHVLTAIHAVMAEMSEEGIGKEGRNKAQGFNFRGIDQVYAALSPKLVKHKLLVTPRAISRDATERASKSGGSIFAAVVHIEFDFLSIVDGSKHTISMYGEGMDSADKATSKAQSIAYKYGMIQAFCIPTEGIVPDADEDTHDPASRNEELRNIEDLLDKHQIPDEKITKAYGVDSLDKIPASKYPEVVERINEFVAARSSRKSSGKS